ncbi:MAG: aminotransferase class V-fold PLP-dependent enzyme, partial [Clostridia bacterium]|nr:aminotransferase class V-fold PLP-dependent enzyme [Clostridia bacterium]
CGSESDNWAIKSSAEIMLTKEKNHIISTVFEHHAVLHPLQTLEKKGFDVTYLPVYENGIVKPEDLESAITDKTGLVTIMFANNEIGTIQPIKELGEICKKHKVLFHVDAVQAFGNVKIDVNELGIDMMSVSGHKIHAQKGIGFLYIRNGVRAKSFLEGGAQERGKRAGTENVPSILGFAKAAQLACEGMEERNEKVKKLRDKFIDGALKIERSRLNGDRENRLPGNANLSFEGIEGESLLLMLDMQGISASSGSACTSGSLDPSHVLLSIGLKHEVAHGSLRVSLNEYNTEEDIDYILEKLPPIIDRLRMMSPLWETIKKEEGNK